MVKLLQFLKLLLDALTSALSKDKRSPESFVSIPSKEKSGADVLTLKTSPKSQAPSVQKIDKTKRVITKLVIHCSDSKTGDVNTIDRWHRERGWSKIGYHYIITRDGSIQKGRDEEEVGAHVEGHNKNSLGICLVGVDQFTDLQYSSLRSLVLYLLGSYGLGLEAVRCHYEFNPGKTCPNIKREEVLRKLS